MNKAFAAAITAATVVVSIRSSHASYSVAVFGNTGLIESGATVANGGIVSNGSVNITGGFPAVGGPIVGNGSLVATNGGLWGVNGPIIFNQNVSTSFGIPNYTGDIHAGGNVFLSGGTQTGNVYAKGSVTEKGTTNGNLAAGNNLTVDGTVNGNATYVNTYTPGTFGSVKGTVTQAPAPNPIAYVPIALPADPFAGVTENGYPDLTLTGTAAAPIAPGHYGQFQPNPFVGGAIYLTAGDYYFSGITLQSGNVFSLNLVNVSATNPVRIFSSGDVQFESQSMTINGQAVGSTLDTSLAGDVLLESHGNITMDGGSFGGAVYAPTGNVVLASPTIVGSIFTGGYADIGTTNLTYSDGVRVGISATVPEPSTMALLAIVPLLTRRRR